MFIMPEKSSVILTSMGEDEWENRRRDQSLLSLFSLMKQFCLYYERLKRQFVAYSYAVKIEMK